MKLFNGNITKGRPAILTYSTSLDTISLHTAVLAYTLLIIIMPVLCSGEDPTSQNTANGRTSNLQKGNAVVGLLDSLGVQPESILYDNFGA